MVVGVIMSACIPKLATQGKDDEADSLYRRAIEI